jgi:hypothetical protein
MTLFPDEMPSQGAQASISGTSFELEVDAKFTARKVRVVDDNREFHYEKDIFGRRDKLLIRQVLIAGVKVDRLFKDFARKLTLPIQCKQQWRGGTTDEKLAYTIDVLIKQAQDKNAPGYWLLLNGDGFNPKITQQMSNKIIETNNRYKLKGRMLYALNVHVLAKAIDELVYRGDIG